MGDDDAIRFVIIEDRLDLAQQIEPILVDQRLAGQAPKRYLLNSGDALELRELAQELALSKSLVRLDVPGQIQTIGTDRIDRSARKNQSHSRQAGHGGYSPSLMRPPGLSAFAPNCAKNGFGVERQLCQANTAQS